MLVINESVYCVYQIPRKGGGSVFFVFPKLITRLNRNLATALTR